MRALGAGVRDKDEIAEMVWAEFPGIRSRRKGAHH
jgi:hypothetical protein